MVVKKDNQKTTLALRATTAANKAKLILAMQKHLTVSKACAAAKIGRTSFYLYLKDDSRFKAEIDACTEIMLDEAEDCLLLSMQGGNPIPAMFLLKTKGKHRGYVEKQEIDHTTAGKAIVPVVNIIFHNAIDIEQIKKEL